MRIGAPVLGTPLTITRSQYHPSCAVAGRVTVARVALNWETARAVVVLVPSCSNALRERTTTGVLEEDADVDPEEASETPVKSVPVIVNVAPATVFGSGAEIAGLHPACAPRPSSKSTAALN